MNRLKIGDKAPDFTAKDQKGSQVSLKDFLGKKLVLFFYPKANTPGCTNEVCNLRDNYKAFVKEGYNLLGVSADTARKQQNWIDKHQLPFNLIADVDKKLINAYKVWGPKKFMGREYEGINRTTFIIDEKGLIEDIISKVKTKTHTEQILKGYLFD